jgi:integrase
MLKRRRLAIGPGVEPVSHTLRKTVASLLDDAALSTQKISDQLGHSKVSMTQDRYLGRRLTDRETADVLENLFEDHTVP